MHTIELVGDKSVVTFDLDELPQCAFIEHSGRLYHRSDENPYVWGEIQSELPAHAAVYVFDGEKLRPKNPDSAPADPPAPNPGTSMDDAKSDQPPAV